MVEGKFSACRADADHPPVSTESIPTTGPRDPLVKSDANAGVSVDDDAPTCLLRSEFLVVRLDRLVVLDDDMREWPITPSTRAEVDTLRGSVAMLAGGWCLSLLGLVVAWRLHAATWWFGAGIALMVAGSWIVHSYHMRCMTRLLLDHGRGPRVVATRVRALGDDVDDLHEAQRAILHAATLQGETFARKAEAWRDRHLFRPRPVGMEPTYCGRRHVDESPSGAERRPETTQ